ncbi:hypothetical protein D7Y27_26050 [Corallococcus sp. AB004]|uniref:hypothetical protein n=1 Tax=Corallococcus sp. AB038B TaxID=2316718 RepID=UPI000EA350EB|nr:hypothetical protein [Corallococcus sp. AB038B]RKI01913.1 hypothetical protein D7Y04_15620 [Corallococcus sp. AB038B]RKI37270.1 hypothetical protein D7Y27_26050 [Corallococcus sp. AB004]
MRNLRALACVLALGAAVGFSGCSDDDDDPKPDGGTTKPDSGTPDSGTPDGGPTGTEFTAFVKDLVENQTSETGSPVTLDDKNFVDSESADAFPPAFFQ